MTGFTCCPSVLDVNHTVVNDGARGIVSRPAIVTCTVTSPDSDVSSYTYEFSYTRDGAHFKYSPTSSSEPERVFEFTADKDFGREQVYTFVSVKLMDKAYNENEYNTSSIKAMGGMTQFTVTNTGAATPPNNCTTPPPNRTAAPLISNMTCCQDKQSSVKCQATSSDRDNDFVIIHYSKIDDSGRSISNGSMGSSTGNVYLGIEADTTLTITKVSVADAVGNTREYGTADIAVMGGTSQIRATNTGAGVIPCEPIGSQHSPTTSKQTSTTVSSPTTSKQTSTTVSREPSASASNAMESGQQLILLALLFTLKGFAF